MVFTGRNWVTAGGAQHNVHSLRVLCSPLGLKRCFCSPTDGPPQRLLPQCCRRRGATGYWRHTEPDIKAASDGHFGLAVLFGRSIHNAREAGASPVTPTFPTLSLRATQRRCRERQSRARCLPLTNRWATQTTSSFQCSACPTTSTLEGVLRLSWPRLSFGRHADSGPPR